MSSQKIKLSYQQQHLTASVTLEQKPFHISYHLRDQPNILDLFLTTNPIPCAFELSSLLGSSDYSLNLVIYLNIL